MRFHVDWGKGLPGEVLALLASLGGTENLKAMRGVNKTWRTGFELGIKGIRVPTPAPPLPEGEELAARFPELAKLDIGDSDKALIPHNWLHNLTALKRLRCVVLGSSEYSRLRFSSRVNGKGNNLAHLQGLPLTSLDLSQCRDLTNPGLEALHGMPLTNLSLRFCIGLSTVGLEALKGMSLASLNLDSCDKLKPGALDRLRALPLTSLSFRECPLLVSDKGLVFLQGLPLTKLAFSGKGNFLHHTQPCPPLLFYLLEAGEYIKLFWGYGHSTIEPYLCLSRLGLGGFL